MPTTFSAATCITSSFVSPGPFNIYLTDDYGSTPFSSVTKDQLILDCPFIFNNIPEGTTTLYIKDVDEFYCFTIPIQDNNICQTCNLGLSQYSATTTSIINAGVLTGTCQSTIVDYKINWYGPNSTTTLAFSSGSGIYATPASTYTHPLSGPGRSIPSIAGVYTPIIDKVKINGITYSNTGGTGNILFSGSCLPTTNVLPLTCDFRTNNQTNWPYSAYTHYLTLDILSNTPQTIISTFKISADTEYIAWAFAGYQNPDRITVTLNGSYYGSTPIGLEDIVIGWDNSVVTNLTPSLFPKSANTGPSNTYFYRKITTLTGLTITDNDTITIKVTPTTTNTLWELYISCLTNWDCDDCYSQNVTNKIIGSSIYNTPGTCNKNTIYFNVSGCSFNDSYTSDLYTYYGFGDGYNYIDNTTISNLTTSLYGYTLFNPTFSCSYQYCPNYIVAECAEDSSPTSYRKTFLTDGTGRGVFGFTGSCQVISSYYNDWVNTKSSCWVDGTSPTSIGYYKMIVMTIPSVGAPNNCDDFIGTRNIQIYLHPTSTVVTGTTGGGQCYMSITTNTITNQYHPTPYGSCDEYCNYYLNDYFVGNINNYSTGSTANGYGTDKDFPITSNGSGVYYTKSTYIVSFIETTNSQTSRAQNGYFTSSTSIGNTYPFSGNPSTIIPSLSGTVCNYNLTATESNYGTYQRYFHYKWYYECRLPNPLNSLDYEIWAYPIVNYNITYPQVLAYRYSGGTVTTSNPTYII